MKIKKAISLFVVLIMCFSVVNVASAEITMQLANSKIKADEITDRGTTVDGIRYTIINNRYAKIAGYIGTATDVIIPSEINGYSVEGIHDGAFCYYDTIESVEIPDSVKNIGLVTFYGCDSLIKVKIGNSVTEIGESVFADCTALTSIDLPESVIEIGNDAFARCYSLTNISIGKYVKTIGKSAFTGCKALKSVEIPNATTVIGDYSFFECESLTRLIIGRNVEKIGQRAFYGCNSLERVEFPGSLTFIGGGAFAICGSLASATIPKNVESIGEYAFYDCPKLTIYGVSGSYTEDYAKTNKIPFIAISENENKFVIREESGYSVDDENGMLFGVVEETSLKSFFANFKNNAILVTSANGEAITDENALVGTGYTVNLIDENGNVQKSVTVLVVGDVASDGRVNSRDLAVLQKHIMEISLLEGVYLSACDVRADDEVNSRDIAQLQKNILADVANGKGGLKL